MILMGKIGAFLKSKDKKTTYYFVPYYPIGSIMYLSTTFNPNGFYIGKWEQITDVFLYACGPKHKAGETGGEEMHKLTVGELPIHRPKVGVPFYGTGKFGYPLMQSGYSEYQSQENDALLEYVGGDQPHNNMPPYRAVYVWERVA